MVFTATPVDGSATPIPMSSAVPDTTNTPLAIEGGPGVTTGGNTLVPVAVYLYDGYNVTHGAKADTAATTDAGTFSLMALLKRLLGKWSASTGAKTNVAGSASSVTILASNAARKGAMIYNDSTAILYLDLSGGTASNSSFTVPLNPQAFFELPGPAIYTGLITGIWAAANGNARVTEFS
jgi:hypothetical protein